MNRNLKEDFAIKDSELAIHHYITSPCVALMIGFNKNGILFKVKIAKFELNSSPKSF